MGYLYVWREPYLNALKLGSGYDPYVCMVRYAKRHKLTYDLGSLVRLDCRYRRIAGYVESYGHRALKRGGWSDGRTWHGRGPRELYLLGGSDYETVVHDIMMVCEPVLERRLNEIIRIEP